MKESSVYSISNSLPNDKFSNRSKLKAFANDKINVKGRKHCGKGKNTDCQQFSCFPTMLSTEIFLKVI